MPILSSLGALSARGFGDFATQTVTANYIEDYFSTYLYDGTGASQTITNNITLATTAAWSSYKLKQNDSYGLGIVADTSGNFYVTGYADDGTNLYIVLAKYDSTGSLQWQRKLKQNNSVGRSVSVDASGNIYVTGGANDGSGYIILAKYDSTGSLQWQRKLRESGSTGRSVSVDASGNVYVTGVANDGTTYIIVAKYNSSGTIQWQRKLNQSSSYGYGITTDTSGNVYVTGFANDGFNYIIVAKYNSSGTIQWQRKLQQNNSYGYGITTDTSGNVYVTGAANDGTNFYIVLAKYNSSGAIQWQRKLKQNNSFGYGVTSDASGNVYVTGNADDGISTYIIVAKYNSSGTIQWQRKLNESGSNGYGITTDTSGNVYVTGNSNDGVNNYLISSKLTQDGSTTSGTAFVTMEPSSATDAAGTATDSAGFATDVAGTATDSAGTATDSAGTATASSATQAATSGSGLVWMKSRSVSASHALYDTSRGATYQLSTDTEAAQLTNTTGLTSFNANGFTIGSSATVNTNTGLYVSWTFRKKSKFFDVVTYTGNGVNGRQIPHGLGSSPGMVIVKSTDTANTQWPLWHKDFLANTVVFLNSSISYYPVGNTSNGGVTSANSTTFTVTTGTFTMNNVNANGKNYVAYVFAHDAGGFGLNGSENVISCGSYTGNGSTTGPSINLGWEPQFLFIRAYSGNGSAILFDNVRGITTSGNDFGIKVDASSDELSGNYLDINSTGFQIRSTETSINANTDTYIYMAIRRGPMKVPTDATTVFQPTVYTGTNVDNRLVNTTIAPDMVWVRQRNDTVLGGMVVGDRLRGQPYLLTGDGAGEVTAADAFDAQIVSTTEYGNAFSSMVGFWCGNNATAKLNANTTASNHIAEAFKRAPSFFDIVAYTGTGANRTVTHNLGVEPELIIIKGRQVGSTWPVYAKSQGNTKYASLDSTSGFITTGASTIWNNTSPTSSVFTVGTSTYVNSSSDEYIAYLFATCAGVSKVGSYTGTGTTQQIDCGFTNGSRFVLIKIADTGYSGGWYVYDSARGIVAADDPYILLNSTAAEVTNTDYVDTYSAGFEISSTAPIQINQSGRTYIFLAIA